ncbi:hypothetical protein PRZ48_004800 [Zasmidium cellare]|uniref:Serine carboxypeptidase n=1 Tax=Zasmidium cellare TaxID=395010 RepID=A0ABR0EQW6_ZASCE|nr:hypothetical protein PRZ48_004800 [Zasmidium cellare]
MLGLYDSVLARNALAWFPPEPEDVITKQVPGRPGVSISYKETNICETEAKAYAGYVHMPSELADNDAASPYNVSMFFWYFEARNKPQHAQTTIYLAGGPGQSSMYGAAGSGGPCTVMRDSNSTETNPWSMTNNVNVLYVDQPVGAGFSYDSLINSTMDMTFVGSDDSTGVEPFDGYNGSVPEENSTFVYGTFPSQDPSKTANNSVNAARTLWQFSQMWFSSFPEYKTTDKRISLWGNSYGGYWVPVSANYMVKQNVKIRSGQLNNSIILPIDSAGWTNGCTDMLIQGEWYPDMAYNNTYDLQILPEDLYLEIKQNITQPGGCLDMIQQCRSLGETYDPDNYGTNATVNGICANATLYCLQYVLGPYNQLSNRSVFDLAHENPDPFPPSYIIGYFNRAWVQRSLGVPLNFTADALTTQLNFFYNTGDPVRIAGAKSIQYLLDSGVKVALVYGDRDYRCPWNGAEQLSLQTNWSGAEAFREAGYQYIHTDIDDCHNDTKGGLVRQHGNFSFSRVFEAGHDVAAYQPRTAWEIFNRVLTNKDISTGKVPIGGSNNTYSTKGPKDAFWKKNKLPSPLPPVNCNLYSVATSCTIEQYTALLNGTAEIEDFNVVRPVGGTAGSLANYLPS